MIWLQIRPGPPKCVIANHLNCAIAAVMAGPTNGTEWDTELGVCVSVVWKRKIYWTDLLVPARFLFKALEQCRHSIQDILVHCSSRTAWERKAQAVAVACILYSQLSASVRQAWIPDPLSMTTRKNGDDDGGTCNSSWWWNNIYNGPIPRICKS